MRTLRRTTIVPALAALLAVGVLADALPARAQDGALPTARVEFPGINTTAYVRAAPTMTIGYSGTNPDGPLPEPTHVRWLLVEAVALDGSPIRTRFDYDMHYAEILDFRSPLWSEWAAYASDASERSVTFTNLEPDSYYLFAVQTLDAEGAASLGLGYGLEVAHIYVSDNLYPQVTISEPYLGESSSTEMLPYEVASQQPLWFHWTASAAIYGGTIVSMRHGWDLMSPDDPNDPGWAVPPGMVDVADVMAFGSGLHSFHLAVTDDSGRTFFYRRIIEVVPYVDPVFQLPLVLIDQVVDDYSNRWIDPQGIPRDRESYRNAFWHFLAEGSGGVAGFNWDRDFVDDVQAMAYSDIVMYRAAVCFARSSTYQSVLAGFRPVDGVDRYVWLTPYQAGSGNLMLVGDSSLDSFFEALPHYMTPLIFQSDAEIETWGGTEFTVGFGTRTWPDGTEYIRGTTMYPHVAAGIAAVDWTTTNAKYIYARPTMSMDRYRRAECVGLKQLVLDPDFKSHWLIGPGILADTVATDPLIDWIDEFNRDQGGLQLDINFPFMADEFVDENISPRSFIPSPQRCLENGAPGGYCIEPMYRGTARFDWYRAQMNAAGDPDWPDSEFAAQQLTDICGPEALDPLGELAFGTARTNDRVYGYLSYTTIQDKPSGKPDVYWGFDPYRFDHDQMKGAVRWVLDMFGLDINP